MSRRQPKRKNISHNNRPWREGRTAVRLTWTGQCPSTTKRQFADKDAAKRQVRLMEAAGKSIAGRDLSVYRCEACGFYHVGKKPPPGQRYRLWKEGEA